MAKEIATLDPKNMVVYTQTKSLGVADNIESSDVQIPTLMLMQSNSTLIEQIDGLKSGDFLNSIDHSVWGRRDTENVELVVFYMFKTQIISDVTTGKKAWLETLPWNGSMELDPYEIEENGKLIRREKCYNYVCFRALDFQELNGKYVASPIIVKFKGGSLKNGKRLNEVFKGYARMNFPSWVLTINLTANQEEKDGSKYWAYNFKTGQQTFKEQQMAAAALCEEIQKLKENNELNIIDDEEANVKQQERVVKNYAEDINV